MTLQTVGTVFSLLIAATGGLAGFTSWWTGRAQARKFTTEAHVLAFRAGVDSAEVLTKSAASQVTTHDALLNRMVTQLAAANDKLDAQEATIAALRDQVNTLTARLVAAGLVSG